MDGLYSDVLMLCAILLKQPLVHSRMLAPVDMDEHLSLFPLGRVVTFLEVDNIYFLVFSLAAKAIRMDLRFLHLLRAQNRLFSPNMYTIPLIH